VDDEESNSKINIDDLYDKKQARDLKQLSIFNKILNRIHKRIQFTSKNKREDSHIWFIVPKYIFGEPIYDNGDCTGYLVTKLEENGFHVRYIHPNTLFISWHNWVPSYVRNQIKKKTGVIIDEKGNVLDKGEIESDDNHGIFNDKGSGSGAGSQTKPPQKQFTPIDKYKPTGKFVYQPEMLEKLDKKVSFNIK
jgi:hypothetical protein